MKNKLITQIQTSMASQLNVAQLEELGKVLTNALNCVEITEKRCPTANSAPASSSTPSPDQGDRRRLETAAFPALSVNRSSRCNPCCQK